MTTATTAPADSSACWPRRGDVVIDASDAPAQPGGRLSRDDVDAARALALDPHATTEQLRALPWRHPQIFLALTGRTSYPGRYRTTLATVAGKGPRAFMMYRTGSVPALALHEATWLQASLGIAGLTPHTAAKIARTAGLRTWKDTDTTPLWMVDQLTGCPGIDEVAVAEFLFAADRSHGAALPDSFAKTCRALLADAGYLAPLLADRADADRRIRRFERPRLFTDHWPSYVPALTKLPPGARATVAALLPEWTGDWPDLVHAATDATT